MRHGQGMERYGLAGSAHLPCYGRRAEKFHKARAEQVEILVKARVSWTLRKQLPDTQGPGLRWAWLNPEDEEPCHNSL